MAYDIKNLVGPVYDIDNQHKFAEIDKTIQDLKSLQGPVYAGVDKEHKYFGVLEQSWAQLRALANPAYDIERKHGFIDLGKSVEKLQSMTYPVREGVDAGHHFNLVQDKVINLRNLSGNSKSSFV